MTSQAAFHVPHEKGAESQGFFRGRGANRSRRARFQIILETAVSRMMEPAAMLLFEKVSGLCVRFVRAAAALGFFFLSAAYGESWTTATLSASGSDATLPVVSLNDSSKAAAVWVQSETVQASIASFGGSWSTASSLQSANGETPLNTWVCINNDSHIVALWGGDFAASPFGGVFTCSAAFGESWSIVLDLYLAQYNTLAHLDMKDSHLMAVIENQNSADEIKAAHAHFGIRWNSAVTLSAQASGANHASLAVSASQYTLAAWEEGSPERKIMAGITFFADGWGLFCPQYGRRLSEEGQNAESPHAAIDNSHFGVVVWKRFDGTNWIIQASSFCVGSEWSVPSSLSSAGGNASEPFVASNASGQFAAVWKRSNGSNDIIQASTMTEGAGWSTPVNLSAAGQNAALPELAINDSGQAAAIWKRSDGTNTVIQAATLRFGQSWSAAADLSQSGQNADKPHIALNAKGEALAIWQRSDGANIRVQYATTQVAPAAPSGIGGEQMGLRAGSQTSFFNHIFWAASPTANVSSYKVYRNGVWVGTLASEFLLYDDWNQEEGVSVTYEVSAVSSGGGESAKVSVAVP